MEWAISVHTFSIHRVKGVKSLYCRNCCKTCARSVIFFKRNRARVVPQKFNAGENEGGGERKRRIRAHSGRVGLCFPTGTIYGSRCARLEWRSSLFLYIDLPVYICHFRPRTTFIGTHWGGRDPSLCQGCRWFSKGPEDNANFSANCHLACYSRDDSAEFRRDETILRFCSPQRTPRGIRMGLLQSDVYLHSTSMSSFAEVES